MASEDPSNGVGGVRFLTLLAELFFLLLRLVIRQRICEKNYYSYFFRAEKFHFGT